MRQTERMLQKEVVTRLEHAPLAAVLIPSPNGIFIPTRDPRERSLAQRIVHQLKVDGQLQPGAPDLVFLWEGGCGCIELKRAAAKTLFGKQYAGRLSPAQNVFLRRAVAHGVPYVVCMTWEEVRDTLIGWGRLPVGWREPEARIGRAA